LRGLIMEKITNVKTTHHAFADFTTPDCPAAANSGARWRSKDSSTGLTARSA